MKPENYKATANGFEDSSKADSVNHYNLGQVVTATIRKARIEGIILDVAGVSSAVMSTKAFGKGQDRLDIIKRMRPGDRITGRVVGYYAKTNQLTLEYAQLMRTVPMRKPEHHPLAAGTICLIDTANLLGFIGPEHAAQILGAIADEIKVEGYEALFFLEYRTYTWARCNQLCPEDTKAMDAFVKREEVALVSDNGSTQKREADAPILQVAEAIVGSVCVSNDQFADYAYMHSNIVGTDRVRSFSTLKLASKTLITIDGLTRAIVVDHAKVEPACKVIEDEATPSQESSACVTEESVRYTGLAAIAKKYAKKGDMRNAERVYAKAAKKDPEAFRALAEMYGEGIGVRRDMKKAARFERLARELEKRRVQCEKRYNRLRAQSLRDGCYQGAHFSSKRREALHIAAISNGHEMICEYFQGTNHGKRMAYGRAA